MSTELHPFADAPAQAPPRSSFLHEVAIVARYELAAMLGGLRAMLFLVSYGVVSGGVAGFFLWADAKSEGKLRTFEETVHNSSPEQKAQAIEELSKVVGRPLIEAFLDGKMPMIVLFVLFFSTFAIPGLVLLVGYGGLADDLSSRFARYVLQRVRRESWLLGKMAAHFAASYAAVLLVHALLLGYAALATDFDVGAALAAMPRIWIAMVLFILGYVAFTALFSAVVSPPFAAFALGAIALFGLWVVSFIPGLGDVWMGSWHMQLWALDPRAIAVYAAHAVVLGGLAYAGLLRRDV